LRACFPPSCCALALADLRDVGPGLAVVDEEVGALLGSGEVIEVGDILANAPDRSKFMCLDGIHMTEPYHRLMAKEWLKYLAKGTR